MRGGTSPSQRGVRRIEELLAFQSELRQRLTARQVRGVVNAVAESLLGYPIITIPEAARLHGVTYPPAKKAIETLVDLGALREMPNRSFAYGAKGYICDPVMEVLNVRDRCTAPHRNRARGNVDDGMDDDERQALPAEGLDPGHPSQLCESQSEVVVQARSAGRSGPPRQRDVRRHQTSVRAIIGAAISNYCIDNVARLSKTLNY